MNKIIALLAFLTSVMLYSQTKQEGQRMQTNQDLVSEANKNLEEGNFSRAEAQYRKVIANDPKNTEARYNLGVAYYNLEKNTEAGRRFVQAAETATTKVEKHKVFHNLGNSLMNDKNYSGAVEAYKNALRNNPKDDETRYNLALAKLMLEEHGDEGGDDEDKEDENEEKEEEEKEDGENEEEDDGGGDSGDDEEKGEEGEEEDQRTGEEENDQGEPDEQDEEGQPQPAEGQLSTQQIQSLLEAMNNEEKKVQDKIQAEKQKGAKTKSEKDW